MTVTPELIDAFERAPEKLRAAVAGLSQADITARPGPGDWSILEVVVSRSQLKDLAAVVFDPRSPAGEAGSGQMMPPLIEVNVCYQAPIPESEDHLGLNCRKRSVIQAVLRVAARLYFYQEETCIDGRAKVPFCVQSVDGRRFDREAL